MFDDDEYDVHLELKAKQIGHDIALTPKDATTNGGVTEVSIILKEKNSCVDLI